MISIVIPTLNGGDLFQEVLLSLDMQQIEEDRELLVVDSSSTDKTVQMAEKFGAKVFSIKREDFDHGGTRTMAALQAKGDILVFMTQDAVLASPQSLAQLIAPLKGADTIAVSYGRQLPSENATPSAIHLRLFNYPESSLRRSYKDRKVYGLKTVFVSNSFAAYRKEMLREVGFFQDGLVFGEDTCAVGRLLCNGFSIQYVSHATVYHSHNYSLLEEFKRYFDIGVLHSSENWLLQEYGKAEGHGASYVKSAVSYYLQTGVWYLLLDMFIRCGVKYMAYKFGRSYKRLPNALRSNFSMNGSWWLKNN
jgi:rhamnosyltransferase